MSTAVVNFQWFLWGYSLVFSHTAGKFIGNLNNIGLRNVLGYPSVGSPRIPDLLFCVYQGMFAAITYAIQYQNLEALWKLTFVGLLLLLAPSLSEVECFHASSTCSFGQPSSTIP